MRPHTLNLYEYCANDPVNNWDPNGLETVGEMLENKAMFYAAKGQNVRGFLTTFGKVAWDYLGAESVSTITDKAIDGEAPTLMDVGMAALELPGVSEVKATVSGVKVSVAVGMKMTLKEGAEEVVERSTRKLAEMTVKDGLSVGTDDALNLAEDFLGDGYEEVAEGVFRSADGKSQVRMTDADLEKVNNHAGAPHMNFEKGKTVTKPNGKQSFKTKKNGNGHVYLKDEVDK